MGANLVRRLMKAGHECVVYDVSADAVKALEGEGATGATTLEEFVDKLTAPRAAWIMVPAAVVDSTLEQLVPLLDDGRHRHRRRQQLLPRRHPPRERSSRSRASTTSTSARAAASSASSAASA